MLAATRHVVALVDDQVGVRVAVAVTPLAGVVDLKRIAMVTWSTPFTKMSGVALFALAAQDASSFVTAHCKVIGGDSKGAAARSAGVASVCAEYVAVLTHLTEVPCAVISAFNTNTGDVLTVVCVAFAVTW